MKVDSSLSWKGLGLKANSRLPLPFTGSEEEREDKFSSAKDLDSIVEGR